MDVSSDSSTSGKVVIDVHLRQTDPMRDLREIRESLTLTPRRLSSRFFYDDHGSQLFEDITEQPEYYQTRTEHALLQRIADELIQKTQVEELVELGSGASTKTRVLLDAMSRAGQLRHYVPFDISEGIVRRVADELVSEYDDLNVHGVIGEFDHHLKLIPRYGQRLMIFLGGTIGNFEPWVARGLLRRMAQALDPGEYFLLGTDLIKDVDVIERAYNDARGVTAQFNLNALSVVNALTEGDFDMRAFDHRAFYDHVRRRIEMWLIAKRRQVVSLRKCGMRAVFAPDDGIRTEISVKYDRARVERLFHGSGLELVEWYTDPQSLFALSLAVRRHRQT